MKYTKLVRNALIIAVPVAGSLAGAADTATIDPQPIATAIITTIGGVMAAGAGIMAVSVGGRVAVKWIKRLVGMA